jgi:hypothetical protein
VGNTQALPGVVAAGDAAVAQEPHQVIYEQALRQIAALDETWQEAVRDVAVPAAAAVVVAPVTSAVPAATPPVPPLPRRPLPVTAEITAIAGPDTAEAVLARAAAPRWRRSLAY